MSKERDKGFGYERAVVKLMSAICAPFTFKRGGSGTGLNADLEPDIVLDETGARGLPIHLGFECKRCEKWPIHEWIKKYDKKYESRSGLKTPYVMFLKRSHQSSKAVMSMELFLELYSHYIKTKGKENQNGQENI